MKSLFLNITQHNLSREQVIAINEIGSVLVGYNEAFKDNDFLIDNLKNSPSAYNEIRDLVKVFLNELFSFYNRSVEDGLIENSDTMYVHLPIGSPAFNFKLAYEIGKQPYYNFENFQFIFSHTEKISVEENGVKTSKFVFSHFIEM